MFPCFSFLITLNPRKYEGQRRKKFKGKEDEMSSSGGTGVGGFRYTGDVG